MRTLTTLGVLAVLLGNSLWVVHCKDSAGHALSPLEESDDAGHHGSEEVPECCRNGMCPHHAAERQQHAHHHMPKPQPTEDEDCICAMNARDEATMIAVTSPAVPSAMTGGEPVVLPSSGPASVPTSSTPSEPDLSIFTPPPRG